MGELFEGLETGKEINELCKKSRSDSNGVKKNLSAVCSICKKQCRPVNCKDKLNIEFPAKENGQDVKKNCNELFQNKPKEKIEKTCKKQFDIDGKNIKPMNNCPSFCKEECKNKLA